MTGCVQVFAPSPRWTSPTTRSWRWARGRWPACPASSTSPSHTTTSRQCRGRGCGPCPAYRRSSSWTTTSASWRRAASTPSPTSPRSTSRVSYPPRRAAPAGAGWQKIEKLCVCPVFLPPVQHSAFPVCLSLPPVSL